MMKAGRWKVRLRWDFGAPKLPLSGSVWDKCAMPVPRSRYLPESQVLPATHSRTQRDETRDLQVCLRDRLKDVADVSDFERRYLTRPWPRCSTAFAMLRPTYWRRTASRRAVNRARCS